MSDDEGHRLHVGLNAHLLSLAESYRSAGISWYIQNLLRHLPAADGSAKYSVFLSETRYDPAPGLRLLISHLPTQHPLIRIFWEQAVQPSAVRKAGVDLLHCMALIGPLWSACPTVVTIHDLSFLHYPRNFHELKRLYLEVFTRLSVQRAERVIAISESTRLDVLQQYGLSPAKVDRVYYGLDPLFHPLPAAEVARFRNTKRLPERFILFVGTLEPRKNIVRLVEAYSRLPVGRPALLLVGGKGWLYDEVFRRIEALDLSGEVLFMGHVPGPELPYWYNAADLFVYPSLYEGFGLPPLEAMACGTPVITSSVSSLPEVVGRAGLTVDPGDVEGLAGAMMQVLSQADTRETMRQEGLLQAQRFSWTDSARQTVSTYRRALDQQP